MRFESKEWLAFAAAAALSLSMVPLCISAGTAQTATVNTSTTNPGVTADSGIDKLINNATSKVLKKLNGVVPDNLKERVQKELDKQLTGANRQRILESIEQKIPSNIKDKLPSEVLTKLGGVKMTKIEKVNYSSGLADLPHQMNVYLPPMQGSKFPLIIYVHGGGWQWRPDKIPSWIPSFVKAGYAVACVNYRLSSEGRFPAQMEDLNTALRFLKSNSAKINVDPDRIGVFGLSAGGHLAALMGTSWNSAAMDPGPADKTVSRKVKAVCDWYGPTDLYALGTKQYPGNTWDLSSPNAPLSLLLGGQASLKKAEADAASPITYVSPASAPILIMHGNKDEIIPVSQSQEFAAALKKAGVDVTYIELNGIRHGFQDRKSLETVRNFFDKQLKGASSS
ncbi:MAG: alpha/beta hydrolase [Candidatus Obscuribacterales bacterium]|nr:alpha/beta hydrolase [Candidatus Obscuribacterales bacterium]